MPKPENNSIFTHPKPVYLLLSTLLITLNITPAAPLTEIFDWAQTMPWTTVTPASTAQLVEIVKTAAMQNQHITLKGAGRSTGGQTAAPNTIQIDTKPGLTQK